MEECDLCGRVCSASKLKNAVIGGVKYETCPDCVSELEETVSEIRNRTPGDETADAVASGDTTGYMIGQEGSQDYPEHPM